MEARLISNGFCTQKAKDGVYGDNYPRSQAEDKRIVVKRGDSAVGACVLR